MATGLPCDSVLSAFTSRSNTAGGGPSIDSKARVGLLPACANEAMFWPPVLHPDAAQPSAIADMMPAARTTIVRARTEAMAGASHGMSIDVPAVLLSGQRSFAVAA